jgi:hypothetical protein
VGPRAGLDAVVKRKIHSPLPGLEPPIIQPLAHRYATEVFRLGVQRFVTKSACDAFSNGITFF